MYRGGRGKEREQGRGSLYQDPVLINSSVCLFGQHSTVQNGLELKASNNSCCALIVFHTHFSSNIKLSPYFSVSLFVWQISNYNCLLL